MSENEQRARIAFEVHYRARFPDADFSTLGSVNDSWKVEWSIWLAAWTAALTDTAESE